MDSEKKHFIQLLKISLFSNTFEWYEFFVFVMLYQSIGAHFFASTDPLAAALQTFATFAVTYFLRPIGAFFFGYLTDKKSAAFSAMLSLALSTLAPLSLVIIPSYQEIGVASSLLLLLSRFVHAFAISGELPSMMQYTYQDSQAKYRILICSIVGSSGLFGILLASATVGALHSHYSDTFIQQQAWRYPFYAAVLLAIFLFYVRTRLMQHHRQAVAGQAQLVTETLVTETSVKQQKASYWAIVYNYKYQLMNCFAVVAAAQINLYTLAFGLPNYLTLFLAVEPPLASQIHVIQLLCAIFFAISLGLFSLKINLFDYLMHYLLSLAIVAPCCFLLMTTYPNFAVILCCTIVFAFYTGFVFAFLWPYLFSMFDYPVRGMCASQVFTLSVVIFGGGSLYVTTWLIKQTHWLLVPAACVSIVCLLTALISSSLRHRCILSPDQPPTQF